MLCRLPSISGKFSVSMSSSLTQDLRKVVYRLVVTEELTDQQVRDYLQVRYGDFVLYDPPFNERTWYIWLVPMGLGLLGMFVVLRLQRRAVRQHTELDAVAQARLQRIVQGTERPAQSSEPER